MNRGSDSVLSVYSDARAEYTKQLYVFLVPAYFQFFIDLLERTKQTVEPKKVLWQFQTHLNEIHDWNMEKVKNEIQMIQQNSGCDYLDDLLTAVFIAHTKVLTAIRLSSSHKKVEINIPKVDHFLFKTLCETAKLLWSSTYLFRDGISGIDKQQNYRTIEGILNEGILQAIRSLVPVKSILKDFVTQDVADHMTVTKRSKEEDSDEEEDTEEKEEKEEKGTILPALAPISALDNSFMPLAPITQSNAPSIINLDDTKPKVHFGQFNSIFSTPEETNMIEEEVTEDNAEDSVPALVIGGDEGVFLDATDAEELDIGAPLESLDIGDYEEL